ncbi:MAG: ATP-dependent DNA helicase [Rhodocyclaceae bacterium]|nr:ATP-dependent DNA helicase [Rhodocyclaceae bacterium]
MDVPPFAFLLGDQGPLAKCLAGFRPRRQQIEMANAVWQALIDHQVVVLEAGTGTGKTFAYLAPVLLYGGKTIVSTGTKTLQDQLFHRDLPLLQKALKTPITATVLKGRQNYVCHYHLERAILSGRLHSRAEAAYLAQIARFAKSTRRGDKADCHGVPEDSPVWRLATSTRENCLGQDCPHQRECFVLAARREALAAELVIVNHHLFLADLVLKDDGLGELLPATHAVIFDEAHQLPEAAALFFGESVSSAQLLDLARDVQIEAAISARDQPTLLEAARDLEKSARDLRLPFAGEARLNLAQWRSRQEAVQALGEAIKRLAWLAGLLESQGQRSEGLAHCLRRANELERRLADWLASAEGEASASFAAESIVWAEVAAHALIFHRTPLSVAPVFQKQMEGHPRAWIFTSATLAVGDDFSHFCASLGLVAAKSQRWQSPFDYARQALLYCPSGMPDPNHPHYADAVAEAAWPLIEAAGGRAFVLCTSLRAMRRIHARLAEKMAARGIPLLLQGEGTKTELLERFRRYGNAVLVASHSFWEGVDVPGQALSLVIIDKLPFAPPDDPVVSARIERLARLGQNAFWLEQLPRAAIQMKQGAGRLIRTETDRGVLMVCDPRLFEKPYGARIWQTLPAMRRTRDLAEALAFFREMPTTGQGNASSVA